jgi:hypothetical protein
MRFVVGVGKVGGPVAPRRARRRQQDQSEPAANGMVVDPRGETAKRWMRCRFTSDLMRVSSSRFINGLCSRGWEGGRAGGIQKSEEKAAGSIRAGSERDGGGSAG